MKVKIFGAGLAGAEAAWQAAKRGAQVTLYEMKPREFSPAHHNSNFAELLCSNSLKSNDPNTASGLLKNELRALDSMLISVADSCAVPAGSALAVDRDIFAQKVTEKLKTQKNIKIINETVSKISVDDDEILIIATGPLTHESLLPSLQNLLGEQFLHFFDAVAPIVTADSIDFDSAFIGGRYGKGDDYVNCPMNKAEFELFWEELVNAETAQIKDFENNVFESCMPIEVMAKRGRDTIRFGPLKPVGLFDERKSERPYAVLQLRKENEAGTIYNLVGFQTHLTFGEQKRVFSLIPALKNAEFVRYGVMHKNTFINAPKTLDKFFRLKNNPKIFFAGQISGVEGYVESIASGLMCGINAVNTLSAKPLTEFENQTMIGALAEYISSPNSDFQPMNANYGILPPIAGKYKDKQLKRAALSQRAMESLKNSIKGV
ncbi:MAG TPA: methylenetetrahydrofolate--tRNA-(uracil(54)-C(5))-methyltransferase (FADH(2)-oxidizing) TrmFO [Eubacteriales bacterium]|nr:methylenetetrahydrofolate--tRNA-(uracil(54)-C(5))-methyltransferase (FADH(2)-oxidizing) TrmFO [Eubacteriales bacterium]